VVQVGTPEEIYDRPATEFVAKFLGSGNVLEGVVKEAENGKSFIDINGIVLDGRDNLTVGDSLKLSIKPEDITVSSEMDSASATGRVISIIPQVGSFKITLDFKGTHVVALSEDEELVTRLRNCENQTVSFSFRSEDAVILND